MASVTLRNVEKVYADGTAAVDDLSLQIRDGELVVLVGPSGCGKTTALRMIAGLETISSGTIALGDEVINHVDPGERDIAMVFQSYALYPHMSVRDNVAFPLKLAGMRKAEREDRVRRVARTVGLEDHLDRKPRQLSGGQRQRVAMARAIVREPQVFLMDEPLSNLDAKLRVQMRAGIAELQRELGVTTVYVTHDQVEAMTLGDRVAVMRAGLLHQCAAPEEIYERPANLFVASFTGAPPMNLLTGTLDRDGAAVQIGASRIALGDGERPGAAAGREVVVGVRPERLCEDGPDDRRLAGVVHVRESLGSDVLVHVRLDGARPLAREAWRHIDDDRREEEASGPAPAGLTTIARLAPRTPVRVDDAVQLAVEPDALHFFDPDTGEVI